MRYLPSEATLAQTTAKAAPWWIALGVTGVAMAVVAGAAPLLSSLALIGIGSDADLGRRLREAIEADSEAAKPGEAALVAGMVRRVHAAMYMVLVVFAWASLLHLLGPTGEGRWWLAADLAGAAILASGYYRISRQMG